jgi:type IV secretion system protein TrbE
VVLNKDGSFQRSARFRGPDLDSATENELAITAERVNNALKRLGSGWALFVEAARRQPADFPRSTFPEALSWLIDEERRASFEEEGRHFESLYTLTLLWLPPAETQARAGRWLFDEPDAAPVEWRDAIASFMVETDRAFSLLQGVMPEVRWLSDEETLAYLHECVSDRAHPIRTPEVPFHLDALLSDRPLMGGSTPMLGEQHLRAITVRGFPTSTWPGVLDELNRLGIAYRWVTRFLFLSKTEAERELTKIRRQWFARRKSIVTILRETLSQQESPFVDSDAGNKATDADAALQELGSDAVAFGYFTTTVIVTDSDVASVEEKRKAIERVIQGRSFIALS